jgi:methylglutaconyl-CoA hydratase
VVPAAELVDRGRLFCDNLLKNGPVAMATAKKLLAAVARRPIGASLIEDTAGRIAWVRAGAEGKEGVGAFLEKRRPNWVKG